MEILLLGTAAAEGWPCPWCACPACASARHLGGPNIRTRSGALIDNCVKIDLCPDTSAQMQQTGKDLTQLTSLIFTHAHHDHFAPLELLYRGPGFVTRSPLPELHVYGNAEVMTTLHETIPSPAVLHLRLHPPLEPFHRIVTDDGTEILPLPAAHAPGALLLCLTRNGKSVLYGHDSGPFPEETLAALSEKPLDCAIIDCTYGPAAESTGVHLGIDGVYKIVDAMRSRKIVTEKTRLIATHFSHNGGLLHDGLTDRLLPGHIVPAYDGMNIIL